MDEINTSIDKNENKTIQSESETETNKNSVVPSIDNFFSLVDSTNDSINLDREQCDLVNTTNKNTEYTNLYESGINSQSCDKKDEEELLLPKGRGKYYLSSVSSMSSLFSPENEEKKEMESQNDKIEKNSIEEVKTNEENSSPSRIMVGMNPDKFVNALNNFASLSISEDYHFHESFIRNKSNENSTVSSNNSLNNIFDQFITTNPINSDNKERVSISTPDNINNSNFVNINPNLLEGTQQNLPDITQRDTIINNDRDSVAIDIYSNPVCPPLNDLQIRPINLPSSSTIQDYNDKPISRRFSRVSNFGSRTRNNSNATPKSSILNQYKSSSGEYESDGSEDESCEENFNDIEQGYENDDESEGENQDKERQSDFDEPKNKITVKNFLKKGIKPNLKFRKSKKVILPSQARSARIEAALSRRNYMINSALNVVRRDKLQKMKDEMREYYNDLVKKVSNFKEAKEKGMIVNEKEYLNNIKKMQWIEKRLEGHSFGEDLARTGKEKTFWLWRYLRGNISSSHNKNPKQWNELARADRDQVKSLIIDLAYALGSYGMPAHRLDYAISAASSFYGIDAEISVTLTQFLVTFHDFMIDEAFEVECQPNLPSSSSFVNLEKEWRNLSHELDSVTSEENTGSLHDASDDSASIGRNYNSRGNIYSYKTHSSDTDSDTNTLKSNNSPKSSKSNQSSNLRRRRSSNSNKSSNSSKSKSSKKLDIYQFNLTSPSIGGAPYNETEAQTKKIVRDEMSFLIQHSTHFIKLKAIAMDLDKLVQLEQLCHLLYNGHLTIKEARERLHIVMKKRHIYSYPPVLFVCNVGSAIAFSVILQATWGEVISVAVAASIITILDLIINRIFSIFSKVFLPLSSILAGFVAILMRWLFINNIHVSVFLVSLCSVINYLPGYGFVTAVSELTEKRNEAGLVRLSGVIMTMLQMGFGIVIGTSLDQVILPKQETPNYTNPLWLQTICIVIATTLWAFCFKVPLKLFSFLFIAFSAVLVFYSAYAVNLLGVSFIGSFVGGMVTGILGQIYSYITRHPSIVISSVVILQQVPGSSGVRAVAAFGDGNILLTVEHFVKGVAISLSIVFGLMLGRLLFPIDKKMSLQG